MSEKSTGQWHGGKGSRPRPADQKKIRENWDRIFNNNKNRSNQTFVRSDDTLDDPLDDPKEFQSDAGC
jgi:hypothetical protein